MVQKQTGACGILKLFAKLLSFLGRLSRNLDGPLDVAIEYPYDDTVVILVRRREVSVA